MNYVRTYVRVEFQIEETKSESNKQPFTFFFTSVKQFRTNPDEIVITVKILGRERGGETI